jgi:3-oxoacyl-ACP reductase-like protein
MLFVAALAVGCGKKNDDAKKDEPAPAPMPTEPTPTEADQPAPPEQPAQAEAPPTPEDFEPTADTEITKANMDEQLKTIEKDLGE